MLKITIEFDLCTLLDIYFSQSVSTITVVVVKGQNWTMQFNGKVIQMEALSVFSSTVVEIL